MIPARFIESVPSHIEYVEGAQSEEKGFDLAGVSQYWHVLTRRKWVILAAALAGAIAGFAFVLPAVPLYKATTSIEIQPVNTGFMNFRDLEPTGTSTMGNDVPTEVAILGSQTMRDRVIEKLNANPEEPFRVKRSAVQRWLSRVGVGSGESVTPWPKAVGYASESVKVENVPPTRVVTIASQSPNPKAAAAFVNTLANEFIDEHLEARWKSAQRTSDWLGRQLEELRKKLQDSEQTLQEYARTSGLTFVGESGGTTASERLAQIRAELFRAQAARMAQQSKYDLLKSGSPNAILEVVEDATLRAYQMKLGDLRQQLADASSTFTPAHYTVRRLQAQITEVDQAQEKVREILLKRLTNDYQSARDQERLLTDAYNKQLSLVTGQEQKSIKYNLIKREVDTNRQMYDAMLSRMKEASVASTMLASNVRVIDKAGLPSKPDLPSPVRFAGMGCVGGAMLASVVILGLYQFDRSLKLPGDTESYLSLPELGVIPAASADPGIRRTPPPRDSRSTTSKLLSLSARESDLHPLELITMRREPSLMAESFRSTLASLLFSCASNGSGLRVIAVTSASPLEGKSTVVSNLGLALAETRRRVLLIDADMRKPRLHSIYEFENSVGLATLLEGNEEINPASLKDVIRPTPILGLDLLPSGPPLRLTANLLHSARMAEVLRHCRKSYDWILVDTPPAIQVVDARLIGRMADGVVLVVRARRTSRELAKAVGKRLAEDGTRIIGTILNDWNPEEAHSNYYADHLRYYEQA